MAITLDQFRAISNGTHNVGQIMLNNDSDGLQKINNHVWQTSKNNVQTEASDNRAVRQALYDAFSNSGNLSPAMLNDIKTILLGGTNGSRSLSRDFVKKLFDTVDHAHEGDDIVNMMNVVSKSLSKRKFIVQRRPKDLAGLVTSSKAAAYKTYASEEMDRLADEGLEGLEMIKEYFTHGAERRQRCVDGLAYVISCLRKMIEEDLRIDGRDEIVANFGGIIQRFTARADELIRNGQQDKVDSFIRSIKPELEQVYNELGLGDFAADHLSRIFPPDEPVPENIGQNQNGEMEQINENQVNQPNVQGDNNIQPVPDDFDKKLSANASEKKDICASQGQAGFEEIKNFFYEMEMEDVTTFSMGFLRAGLDKIRQSLADMLDLDASDPSAVRAACTKLEEKFEQRIKNETVITCRLNDLVRSIKDLVTQVYGECGIQNLAEDHLARIFPPEFMGA